MMARWLFTVMVSAWLLQQFSAADVAAVLAAPAARVARLCLPCICLPKPIVWTGCNNECGPDGYTCHGARPNRATATVPRRGRRGLWRRLRPIRSRPFSSCRAFMTCGRGCNEIYINEWISDHPDCCDPCDKCTANSPASKVTAAWARSSDCSPPFTITAIARGPIAGRGDRCLATAGHATWQPIAAVVPAVQRAAAACRAWSRRLLSGTGTDHDQRRGGSSGHACAAGRIDGNSGRKLGRDEVQADPRQADSRRPAAAGKNDPSAAAATSAAQLAVQHVRWRHATGRITISSSNNAEKPAATFVAAG